MATDPETRREVPSHPLRWLPEFWELGQRRLRPQARMLGLALVVGIVAGLGAIVFHAACQVVIHGALDHVLGYHPLHPGGEPPFWKPSGASFRPWLLLLVPTLGGLLSGLLVFKFAPEAEGHGTDAAIAAFHHRQGYIRPQVPVVKLVASALTIGTGGSGGREGPIAQIGAGFGSLIGGLFRLHPAERRVLMAAGVGAGVAAIFRAPLAGALFAAEILYNSADFESDVIVPAALASTAAYCTFGIVFGWTPLFTLSPEILESLTFGDPRQLISYLLLALFLVVLSMIYTRSFYGLSHALARLPLPRIVKPALGALATGAIGLALYFAFGRDERVLAVISAGYGVLQGALTTPAAGGGELQLALMLMAIALGKILTTGLTIGSGGSGGVFGPSMVIGGCGGGALGVVLYHYWPALSPHPAAFVIVGMAGFFAAAAKTPVSTLIIVSEMTGDYHLLLPTLWVCVITFLLSDEQSLYRSQLVSRSLSPAHQGDYVREVLAGLTVGEFLHDSDDVRPLQPEDRLGPTLDRLAGAAHVGLPVADAEGRYLGMVSLEEIHVASHLPSLGGLVVVADLMNTNLPALRREDTLDRALDLFAETDRMALAVVSGGPGSHVLGLVRRADISTAYLRRVQGSSAGPVDPRPA